MTNTTTDRTVLIAFASSLKMDGVASAAEILAASDEDVADFARWMDEVLATGELPERGTRLVREFSASF